LEGGADCLAVEMGGVARVGAGADVDDEADAVPLDQREERLQGMVGMADGEEGNVPAHAACPSGLDGRVCLANVRRGPARGRRVRGACGAPGRPCATPCVALRDSGPEPPVRMCPNGAPGAGNRWK